MDEPICDGCLQPESACACEPCDLDAWVAACKARGVDVTKPLGPVTREMEIALAKVGIFRERFRLKTDGTVERIKPTTH